MEKQMLSLVMPTFTISKKLEEMTLTAIASYKDQVDQLIVTEDGGFFSPRIFAEADVYLYHKNYGYVKNTNSGWRLATEPYVAIVNSDTILRRGNLSDLCKRERICCPVTRGQNVDLLSGHFFVVPNNFTPYFDQRFHTFCADAWLERQYADQIETVPSVEIYHEVNATLKEAEMVNGNQLEKDREVFRKLCSQ
jgi:hypothetical protein